MEREVERLRGREREKERVLPDQILRYSRAPQHSPDRAQNHTGQQDRAGETSVNILTWTDGEDDGNTDSRERMMYEKWIKAEMGFKVRGKRNGEILK